jgi:hypothetical protein
VTISVRSGTVSAEKWAWADGGELGFWRVHGDPDSPLVQLVRADAARPRGEIEAAWGQALAS